MFSLFFCQWRTPVTGRNANGYVCSVPADPSAPVPTDGRWTTAPVWSCRLPRRPPSVSERSGRCDSWNPNVRQRPSNCAWLSDPTAPPSGPCTLQCMNGGSCFLNARKQPKCRCQPKYKGDRCEIDQCKDYCRNGGICTPSPTGNFKNRTDDTNFVPPILCSEKLLKKQETKNEVILAKLNLILGLMWRLTYYTTNIIKQTKLFVFLQVLLPADAWQASQGRHVTCTPARITARTEATVLSAQETSPRVAAPRTSSETSASTVSVPLFDPI